MYGILDNNEVIAKFVAPMSVTSNRPIFVADALNLRRHVSARAAQRWEIETSLEPLTFGAEDLFVLFTTKGHFDKIAVRMPQNIGALRSRSEASSATVNGTELKGSVNITLSGYGEIPKGTFIRFNGHSKIYMLTSRRTAQNQTVGIYPSLQSDITDGTSVYHRDDVEMECYIDTDTLSGMSFTDGIIMDLGKVKLVEAI